VNERAAEALDAKVGDTIVLRGSASEITATVVGIVNEEQATGNLGGFDDGGRPGGIVMPMATVQEATGHTGEINYLGISLQGGVRGSLSHAEDAAARIETFVRSDAGQQLIGVDSAIAAVETSKLDSVNEAEEIGNMFTSFFIIFGLFSIAAGIMLIFLIFVMLAAERKPEMGMARAVGAQRSNLVQSFLAEGVSYNLLAGVVGCALGVAASVALVVGYLRWELGSDFDFITAHVTVRSLIVSYCLGAVITFLTVVIASIKNSSVNIVSAIRGTPEDETPEPHRDVSWRWVALSVPAMIVPPLGLWFLLRKGFNVSWAWILGVAGIALGLLCIYGANSNGSEFLFSFGFSILPLSVAGIAAHYRAPARVTWTLVGMLLGAYWISPVNVGEKLLNREFTSDIEMFVVSGIMVVISFTLIIVFNARLLTSLFQNQNGSTYRKAALVGLAAIGTAAAGVALGDAADGIGQLAYLVAGLLGLAAAFVLVSALFPGITPALKMGVAYPLSNRFRTGMTIAMFSLIIFSLTTFTIVVSNFNSTLSSSEATGGWDVIATANRNGNLDDVAGALRSAGAPEAGEIEVAGRVTVGTGSEQVRRPEVAEWSTYPVLAMDDGYLSNPELSLEARANGYESDAAVLQAVQQTPYRALLDASTVDSQSDDPTYDWDPKAGITDGRFQPFQVEVRDSETGMSQAVTVVGVLSTELDASTVGGVYVSASTYATVYGEPDYQAAFISLNEGVDARDAARGIEAALTTQGVQADSIEKLLGDAAAQDQAFNRMFQAFMALGLVVGIAALGVIAFRSVVERRQQIGMLRAIGYQSNTVAMTFVLECAFIALMGILSGVVGGVIVSHNLFSNGQFADQNISFAIPWMQMIGFVVAAFVVSLAMTYWPSRSAANVPVADALRYE
jgi:putative ABC transport system permease protein